MVKSSEANNLTSNKTLHPIKSSIKAKITEGMFNIDKKSKD